MHVELTWPGDESPDVAAADWQVIRRPESAPWRRPQMLAQLRRHLGRLRAERPFEDPWVCACLQAIGMLQLAGGRTGPALDSLWNALHGRQRLAGTDGPHVRERRGQLVEGYHAHHGGLVADSVEALERTYELGAGRPVLDWRVRMVRAADPRLRTQRRARTGARSAAGNLGRDRMHHRRGLP